MKTNQNGHTLRNLTNRVIAVIDDPRQELAQGHDVVDVQIHGRQSQGTVAQILRAHGAHFINAYGQWTIEGIAA